MGWYIFKALLAKSWLILGIPLVAGVVAYFLTLMVHQEYKSTAKLATGFTLEKKGPQPKENEDLLEAQVDIEDLIEMMKSEPINSMVSYNLLLHDLSGEIPFRVIAPASLSRADRDSAKAKLKANITSFKLLSSYDEFERRILLLLEKLSFDVPKWSHEGKLSVVRMNTSDLITVEFLSEDPDLSAFVVNTICNETIRYYKSLQVDTARNDSIPLFEAVAVNLKRQLDSVTERVRRIDSANTSIPEPPNATELAPLADYRSRLQEEENKARRLLISLRNVRSRITALENRADSTRASGSQWAVKMEQLQRKIDELKKIYVEKGSKDKALASSIEQLQAKLQSKRDLAKDKATKWEIPDELRDETKRIETEYARVESKVVSMRARIEQLQRQPVSRKPDTESDFASAKLKRERDVVFADYSTALKKWTEAKKKAPTTGIRIKLTVPGKPNDEPESAKAYNVMTVTMMIVGLLCLIKVAAGVYSRARIFTPLTGKNWSNYRKVYPR